MRLGFLIRATAFLIVSMMIGIGSARWFIAQSAETVPIGVGSWKIWAGGREGTRDPYGAAHYLLTGRLPPPANQVRVYETNEDDDGAPLDSDCIYSVSGPAQGARWWQVAIIDPESGARFDSGSRIGGVSSAQIVRNPDGSFNITIAREPMPGNWISPGTLSRYSIAMSLRFARQREPVEPAAVLPRIARGACS